MKVERIIGYGENGCPTKQDIRLMRTTCPQCKKAVEFIMLEDDFIKEDRDFLEELNLKYREEIIRLNKIISMLINNSLSRKDT